MMWLPEGLPQLEFSGIDLQALVVGTVLHFNINNHAGDFLGGGVVEVGNTLKGKTLFARGNRARGQFLRL